MTDLGPAGFSEFFRALWGYEPFPWQAELARRVLTRPRGPWPEAIAVPTAAGKTACIDIAVFALAAQPTQSPRRIWFVVDRRVIVDEAHDRSRHLGRKLAEAREGIVREVAERLREVSNSDQALAAHLLRGGVYRDDGWARSPLQAAVISSTVDQFGSRLLFRAYGRSQRAWPIQAGLAGNDSLVLLDEAHCAKPFLETLRAVRRYRVLGKEPLPVPFHAVVMSATPPADVADRHDLQVADREHPELKRRLSARKPARLVPPVPAGKQDIVESMARSMAEQATALVDDEAGRKAIVVFCNRVATARRVHEILQGAQGFDPPVLLTGRMRSIDKDDVIQEWLERLGAAQSRERRLERPVVVVATQTLEVGANLDFDGLVSECASLDALRQRMGRLNRMGRSIEARAALLVAASSLGEDPDPVYGQALARTWAWLSDQAGAGGEVDFGVQALGETLPAGEDLEELNAPATHAPVLLPSHLDALVQTWPVPTPSPDPSLFLHGPGRGAADVQVCWRADLDVGQSDDWISALVLCPPTAAECLPVPYWRIRQWFAGSKTGLDASDVEGDLEEESAATPCSPGAPRAVRWLGRNDAGLVRDPSEIRPGDTLVIPAAFGDMQVLGCIPPGAPVDRGDQAHREARGKPILRLHEAVIADWPETEARGALARLAKDVERREEDGEAWLLDVKSALTQLANEELPPRWSWLLSAAGELARDPNPARMVVEHPSGVVVLHGTRRLKRDQDGGFTDEDDATASGMARVPLKVHLQRVGFRAKEHAARTGVPAELATAVAVAAANHDLGKADPRFQAWLNGGKPGLGVLLAKSTGMPQGRRESRVARELARYPEGGRHELLSVRLLEAVGMDEEQDLVRHLVESHHGYCRPFAPVVVDPTPADVTHPVGLPAIASSATGLERIDSGTAERFWTLTRRFGWWGLAWLEALVRLADHIESAEEQG